MKDKSDFECHPHPARYELIDKWGRERGQFRTAQAAADWAAHLFPDQEQDPDRTGKGWNVQVAS